MSASTIINSSSIQNGSSTPERPQQKKRWLGHSVCGVDKITWLLGCVLLVSGIVLFVLHSLYAVDFYIAATTTTSVGGGAFLFGFAAHCCSRCCQSKRFKEIVEEDGEKKSTSQKTTTSSTTITKTFPPLGLTTTTEDFFASKGIFGLPKTLIEEINIWRHYRADPENFSLTLDAGFILYGPPGTGKTTIATHIAELLGGEYIEKASGDLRSRWHGEDEQNITALFPKPEDTFRVIMIDEINGLLPIRSGHWSDRVTEHFLGIVSGTEKKPNYLVIGTTNHKNRLDPASVRSGRLGAHFKVSNPKTAVRKQILAYHLNKISFGEEVDINALTETLARKTHGFNCAAIVGFISKKQRAALLANRQVLKKDFDTT